MAMNSRLGGPTWLIPAGLLALVGAGAVALWRGPRSAPSLDEICALARQHQFDRAEDLMTRYLRIFPGDNRAHLLMAQFALDRSDPEPQRALDHLGEIQPRTSREAAVVRFSAWFKNGRFRVALGISARTLIGPARWSGFT